MGEKIIRQHRAYPIVYRPLGMRVERDTHSQTATGTMTQKMSTVVTPVLSMMAMIYQVHCPVLCKIRHSQGYPPPGITCPEMPRAAYIMWSPPLSDSEVRPSGIQGPGSRGECAGNEA